MNRYACLFLLSLSAMLTGMSCAPEREYAKPPIPTSQSAMPAVPAGDAYLVKLETSQGNILIEVHPEWAPRGAAQFRELVEAGFYNDCRFFRVLPGFMCQIGMNGDPAVHARWKDRTILDDPVIQSNQPGYVTFAKTGMPNSRSTQFFINYGDNAQLDGMAFAPFGKVIEGMEHALAINSKYGETPDQDQIRLYGNEYLNRQFPGLDYIIRASVVDPAGKETAVEPQAAAAEGSVQE